MRQQTEAQCLLRLHHMQLSVGKQLSVLSRPLLFSELRWSLHTLKEFKDEEEAGYQIQPSL